MYDFGKMMRKLIEERGTTQAEISRGTGIKRANVSLMCNGVTKQPSIYNCKKIAEFFGMTLDELWSRLEDET